MKVDHDNFKKAVKRLENSLKENNVNLSHSKILDITSKTFGFKNYNEFKKTNYNENIYKIILTFSDINTVPMYIHQVNVFFPQIKDYISKTIENRLTLDVSNLVKNDSFDNIASYFFLIASFFKTIIKKERFSEIVVKEKIVEDQNNTYSNEQFIFPKITEKHFIDYVKNNVDCPQKEDIYILVSNAYKIHNIYDIDISLPLLKSLMEDNVNHIYGNLIQSHCYHDKQKLNKILKQLLFKEFKNKMSLSHEINLLLKTIKSRHKITDINIANEFKKICEKIDQYTYRLDGKQYYIPSQYSAFKIDFIDDKSLVIMGIPSELPSLNDVKLDT